MIRLEVYGVIYGIELLLDNRIYIGQSRNVKRRISAHKCGKTSFIDKAIQKYGWQNFTWIILEKCGSQEELDEAEKRWILKLCTVYPNGFNRTFGGKTNCQYIEDVSKKMSKSRKGKKLTQNHKNNISLANKGKIVSIEQSFKASIAQKKIFYPNLEKELEKRQLTHNEFARRLNLGLKVGTITAKLIGNCIMDEKTAQAIKNFLGVDMPLEELFKKKDE